MSYPMQPMGMPGQPMAPGMPGQGSFQVPNQMQVLVRVRAVRVRGSRPVRANWFACAAEHRQTDEEASLP